MRPAAAHGSIEWTWLHVATHRWQRRIENGARFSVQAPCGMPADESSALLRLLADSLARGHWRVACKRYLMLLAAQADVPQQMRAACESHLGRCDAAQLARMKEQAAQWARMCGNGWREASSGLPVRSAEHATRVRTVWMEPSPYRS